MKTPNSGHSRYQPKCPLLKGVHYSEGATVEKRRVFDKIFKENFAYFVKKHYIKTSRCIFSSFLNSNKFETA